MTNTNKKTQTIVKIAVLGAIGFLLMLIEFPIPFMPPWMKIDISEIAVISAGFGMGPMAAVAVAFIKNLLHFLLKNNDGTIVGEVAAFIIGVAIAVPASLIYRREKTTKNMAIGLLVGGIVMTVTGALMNAYVLIPVYARIFMPMDALIDLAHKANPLVGDLKTLIFAAVVPFNILKAVMLAILMLLVYNRVDKILSVE